MLLMLDIAVDVNQKNPYQKKTEVVKKGGGVQDFDTKYFLLMPPLFEIKGYKTFWGKTFTDAHMHRDQH